MKHLIDCRGKEPGCLPGSVGRTVLALVLATVLAWAPLPAAAEADARAMLRVPPQLAMEALPGFASRASPTDTLAAGVPRPRAQASPLGPEQMRQRTWLVLGGSFLAVSAFAVRNGWADNLTGEFGTRSEGWFGGRTYAGGADKFGHAFAGHAGTRLLASGLRWARHSREGALRLAALSTFGVRLGVEILDGFERGHQFSWEDLAADAAGVGVGYLLESRPELDALVDFRIQYWPSDARRRAGAFRARGGDNDGYTWLLALKGSGVPALRDHPVLRYLELSIGYGTMGYDAADGANQFGTRHIYYGISLNLSEVLNATVFRSTPRAAPVRRISETVLEYVQMPGTALLADHRLEP
ncbi:MAG: DUF2279 domain-containing protein [Burkholderiales bacterium]|nr:MAG: DUF2279 domain-containing protein [Burkholderiales bacterium]